MTFVATFRATVDVLSTAEGGRQTPFFSGYRPQFYLQEYQTYNDVRVTLESPNAEQVAPGARCTARITFAYPECIPVLVEPGLSFALNEGSRTVARGTITEIVDTVSESDIRQWRQFREDCLEWLHQRSDKIAPIDQDRRGREE